MGRSNKWLRPAHDVSQRARRITFVTLNSAEYRVSCRDRAMETCNDGAEHTWWPWQPICGSERGCASGMRSDRTGQYASPAGAYANSLELCELLRWMCQNSVLEPLSRD